jgi:hypothetical protein
MGISYIIIDRKNNQIVRQYPLGWLREYLNGQSLVPNFEQMAMIEYCQDQIEKISLEIEKLKQDQNNNLIEWKKDLIVKIKDARNQMDILNLFRDYQDKMVFDEVWERRQFLEHHLEKLLAFQNFLIPYIWNNQYLFKGELSY